MDNPNDNIMLIDCQCKCRVTSRQDLNHTASSLQQRPGKRTGYTKLRYTIQTQGEEARGETESPGGKYPCLRTFVDPAQKKRGQGRRKQGEKDRHMQGLQLGHSCACYCWITNKKRVTETSD